MAVTTPLLSAIDLGIGYGDTVIGRRLNMAVSPGEVFCLLGPNGSGKTTLFKTLLGLIPAQSGTVHLSGSNILTLKRDETARRVAYVPQAHAAHFQFIVRDMVVMGRTAHQGMFAQPSASDRRMADDALARLGIAALADRDYTKLSGGQRQLVPASISAIRCWCCVKLRVWRRQGSPSFCRLTTPIMLLLLHIGSPCSTKAR
jgi:iron complex transport system ATP-binding protein